MSDPQPDWARLGRLLTQRRGQLGSEYLNRQRFVQATGLNDRLVSDLENARRDGYRPATIAAVEAAYKWKPGSINEILAGGDPEPLPTGVVAEGARSERPRLEALDGGAQTSEDVVDEEERRFLRDLEQGIVWETPPHGLLDNSEVIMWALPIPPLARWRAIHGKRSAQEDSAKERSRRQPEADGLWESNGG